MDEKRVSWGDAQRWHVEDGAQVRGPATSTTTRRHTVRSVSLLLPSESSLSEDLPDPRSPLM